MEPRRKTLVIDVDGPFLAALDAYLAKVNPHVRGRKHTRESIARRILRDEVMPRRTTEADGVGWNVGGASGTRGMGD